MKNNFYLINQSIKIKYIKMKIKYFILLLFLLCSQVYSIIPNNEEIKFNGNSYEAECKDCNEKFYTIIFETQEIKNYLKIEVENTSTDKNPNYVIAFSNNDDKCQNREQLSQGIKSSQMWLTKNQTENKNKYLHITCSSTPCNYKLKLNAYDNIEMDFNTQFNLYVTENNKNVEILFSSESSAEEFDFISVWAIGNKNIKATLDSSDYENKKYSKNNIFKIQKASINKSAFILTLEAEVGDVINIGSNIIKTNSYSNLIINQPEVKGFLLKEYSTQDCYQFSKDSTYTSSSNFYLTGIIYSKIAEIYYRKENGDEISESVNIIKNGSFIHSLTPNSENANYFCIRFPTKEATNYDIDEIYYSLQLTDPTQSENKINLYSPQIIGEQYPRLLQAGEFFLFTGVSPNDSVKKVSFDMVTQFGFPDLYFDLCKNYPLCDNYNDEEIKKITNPRSINGHSSYKTDFEKRSPMDPNQYVLIVKCVKNENIGGPCGFKTSFNTNIDKVILKENEPFSQYILKGEKDLYKIDYSGEKKIQKIYVDLLVFTGDVIFNTDDTRFEVKKIFNSNKISYSITINQVDQNKEIIFSVSASKNSYYSINFVFIRENDDSWITDIIDPGASYLVTIDPEAKDSSGQLKPYKIVKFTNLRMQNGIPFLVHFYSLNCRLNVTAKRIDDQGKTIYVPIESFDKYYQDIVLKDTSKDNEYILHILETDSSNYENKLCMVYASSLELEHNEILDERQIVISDNEPKQMAFKEKYDEIEYLYPHSDPKNDVIIKFNLVDIAKYQVNITFAHQNLRSYNQNGNDIIYLIHNEWKNQCKENEICPIIIKIKLISHYVLPKLLISVKAVQDNTPSYIIKNQAKLDFLLGNNWQYFYTDLGLNEEGDVLVNYRRGSGRLYAKIVAKNAAKPEEGAHWREMYKFPTTVEESLEFFGYIKKILIKKEDTSICKEGCYLLLSLKTSILSEQYFDFREHPFTIIVKTKSSDKVEDIPIINLSLNEYVIGNLYTHEDQNIYEYYSTIFTHDSHKITIDFQSNEVNYYIKVGANNKPSINDYDFYYESKEKDELFEITKEDFIQKCKERGIPIPNDNSLLGLSMTIGLYTNKTDSLLYTTVYSLKVHLPFDKVFNIYEVKSDQKTLCKTELIQGHYRCLFVVFYLGIDPINNLILYPQIQDHSSYFMFANYIFQENYEYFDSSYLRVNIPNEEAKFSTKRTGLEYISTENPEDYDTFLYVNVQTTTETIVELFSSFYTKDIQLSPNPSSPQLFAVRNDHFLLEFTTDEDLIINIQSICGDGTIYWEADNSVQYSLKGKETKLSLTSSLIDKSDPTKVFSKLYIKNNNPYLTGNCPGFAFYINYLLRPSKINLDEIQFGRSTQLAYRNTDLPVYIYSKLSQIEDTNIFVSLYDLVGESYSQFTKVIPFELNACIVNESKIMEYMVNPEKINDIEFDFNGRYDAMIKTGLIFITKEQLNNKEIKFENKPYILIKVTKNKNYPNMKNFTRINLEASVIQDNSSIPISPKVYQYGKLSLRKDYNTYRLKTEKSRKYMRIHFSPNSQNINFAVSIEPGAKTNYTFQEITTQFVNGKGVFTFNSEPNKNTFIYLTIFHNNDQKAESEGTTNYVFKYMNSESANGFNLYELPENSGFQLDSSQNGDNFDYKFTITPLPYPNLDILYLIKFVSKEDWIEGEADNSIALRESPSLVQEINNPQYSNERIVKEFKNIPEIDYRYVQVIALVRDKGIVEYVSYQSIYIHDSILWKILLIIFASIIVLVVLIYLIHIYLKRKRNINNKISKIDNGPMVSRASEL